MRLLQATSLLLPPLLPLVSAFSCPFPQAVFPVPIFNPSDPLLKQLQANLTAYFDAGIALEPNSTSVSMLVTSANATLWEAHHTSLLLANSSVRAVDKNTVYRIASVSKVFAVAAGMQLGWSGQEVIADLVPELRGKEVKGGPKWGEITVGMLGGQTAGLRRDWALFDARNNEVPGIGAVLPPVGDGYAPCGRNATDKPCSRKEFFDGIKAQSPLFDPGYSTSYSNIAYNILGFAVETQTKTSWDSFLKKTLFSPLKMTRTSSQRPKSGGVIPALPNDWFMEAGAYFATGGLYSSTSDLASFLRALLSLRIPRLSPGRVRTWLSPTGFTASGASAQGAPWEIMRPRGLTPDNRRVTIYTKNGALTGYYSIVAAVPELGVGWTVLTAGLPYQQAYQQEAGVLVVQALEQMARVQTRDAFAGVYSGDGGNATVVLAVDSGPGLRVTSWVNRGVDVLLLLSLMVQAPVEARLFPTNVGGGKDKWRMLFEVAAEGPEMEKRGLHMAVPRGVVVERDGWRVVLPAAGGGFGAARFGAGEEAQEAACITDADGISYGGRAVNEFAFVLDAKGKASAVEMPGLRVKLVKRKVEAVVDEVKE